MYAGFHEEGDRCPEINCSGQLNYEPVENCSCHISPPCSACTHRSLICDKCGFTPEEPEYKDVPAAPGLFIRQFKPRPLDKTKIDYRKKSHTSSSMIVEGVYPEGTTAAEVRKVVDGTFGGRFEHFGNGTFKFIAYTD